MMEHNLLNSSSEFSFVKKSSDAFDLKICFKLDTGRLFKLTDLSAGKFSSVRVFIIISKVRLSKCWWIKSKSLSFIEGISITNNEEEFLFDNRCKIFSKFVLVLWLLHKNFISRSRSSKGSLELSDSQNISFH